MFTARTGPPGLLFALLACLGTLGVAFAADPPVATDLAAESPPAPAAAATASPPADAPVVAPVPATPAVTGTPEPAPAPAAIHESSPNPARAADKPTTPRRIPRPAAVTAKPNHRAVGAKTVSAPPVAGQRLAGRLELAAGPNQRVSPGEVAEGVIYFLPKAGGRRPKPARFTVDTQSKGFSPSLLVVPAGSTVSFPNRDQILHNVFSKTPGAAFDLGYFAPGETRETRFSKPGLVVVNCSVHNAMRSNVLVLATPHYARPGRDGRFSLDGLPPGAGTLVFWHPRANAQSLLVTAPVSQPLLRRLVAIRAPLEARRN